jgi:putative tryptophan/tyrosine transport system substrate-binding protein
MFDRRRRAFITLLGGAAATWPLAARAQQAAMPVIGYLNTRGPDDAAHLAAAFRRGLRDGGFSDGQNVRIEFRWGRGQFDSLKAMAEELCRIPVSVLAATGGEPAVLAAKSATSTIPIVFAMSSDPIKLGLAVSFNRPGGNATGVNVLTTVLEPKRLGLLHDLVPTAGTIGILVNPSFPPSAGQVSDVEKAARAIGVSVHVLRANSENEIDAAFQTIATERIGALAVAGSPFFDTHRSRITALAAQHGVPTMYHFREYAAAGGLISYGVEIVEVHRQVGLYAGRILNGTKPGDLPITLPSKFELVINLRTAKTLGLKISDNMLTLADEVIE